MHGKPGEYFVFQTGIWTVRDDLKKVQVQFSDLKSDNGNIIPSGQVTCFNAGGINYEGKPFTKQIKVAAGQVQALWMGINIPDSVSGNFDGTVTITAGNISRTINVRLHVDGKALTDHGFGEGKGLSRLAWLNSTAGSNDRITKG